MRKSNIEFGNVYKPIYFIKEKLIIIMNSYTL